MTLKKIFPALLSLMLPWLVASCDGSSSGEFEYVAMGASDATGIGATPLDEGYVFEIADALEADGYDVGLLNLGIPGAETDEVEEIELPVAVEENPELVTIFTGVNDLVAGVAPDSFRSDLDEILRRLSSETPALVVIANFPDLTQLPRFQQNPDQDVTPARIAQFNSIIADLAGQYGVPIVDLAAVDIENFQVSNDGFHPSDEGHQLIADLFLEVIRPRLPPPDSGT
ncbi:MAG: SGNH/GDSL hydrolase family protein [Deltaproteobacteria bacterium]|nr:SGNH/GDSL hydrolase family protein [Deltaproteobacteria bacterium]